MDSKQHYWVIAFDIERSGATAEFETIAIGATVLGENYRVLASYLGTSYVPGETKFEKRCNDEFWSKHMDILEKLRNDKPSPYAQKQKEMIVGFVEFVKNWELTAAERKIKLYKVCDNSSFDVHFLNMLIHEHYDNKMLPFPYNFYTQQYDALWETTSMAKGFLLAVDPNTIHKQWGFTKILQKLYSLPICPVAHDHLPFHDAQCIAYDFVSLMGISAGCYKLSQSHK